jgi:hypothetical protein
MNHKYGPSSKPKNMIGELVYRKSADGSEGSGGYDDNLKGKIWDVNYYDDTKQNVDEETLIRLRKAHENRLWEKGSSTITISPTDSYNLPGYLVGSIVRSTFEGFHRVYEGVVRTYDQGTKMYMIEYDDEEEN